MCIVEVVSCVKYVYKICGIFSLSHLLSGRKESAQHLLWICFKKSIQLYKMITIIFIHPQARSPGQGGISERHQYLDPRALR